MPKPNQGFSDKFNTWIKKTALDQRKYFEKGGNNNVFCNVCCKNFSCARKFQLDQHITTNYHKRSVERSTGFRQPMVNEERTVDHFNKELCNAMLAADIPFNKLEHPKLKCFLEKYCKRAIPSVWTVRNKHVKSCYNEIIEKIRGELRQKHVWFGVDETTDKAGRFVANVMVGCLDGTDATPHLLMSKELKTANNATVSRLILDAIHFLWPGKPESEINKQFAVLLSDAAPYMSKTGKNLKKMYPGLLHITCTAHGLHRVAETVRGCYKNVDKLVASIKSVFKKSPYRVRKYNQMLPGLPLPPEPVLTRWGTWLEAVEFLSANFVGVKSVVDSFDEREAECIKKAQTLFEKSNIRDEIANIATNFSFLARSIKKLETRNLPLVESVGIIEDAQSRLSSNDSSSGLKIKNKLEYVLDKNTGFGAIRLVADILKGKTTDSTGMDPGLIVALKYCPLTSVEVERGFSMEKALFTDKRHSLTMENLEMYLVCHFEMSVNDKSP